jgi:serine/threonine protein kinase/tetratricopeptide (TPR) repeat protein
MDATPQPQEIVAVHDESALDSFFREVARFSGAPPAAQVQDRTGTQVGSFVLYKKCGQGGMGVVYAGQDLRDGRAVAVKVLPATLLADAQRARRFTAEAEVLASLEHPAIVRYVAHGQTPSGEPYLAMEWLDGEDLGHRLRRSRLTIRETVMLGLRIAEALAVAHAEGVVHRDIKPSNLFLRGGDATQITLLDFGVARIDRTAFSLTATGAVVGTPGYMAPEQARGEAQVDARADVFSLGCVLFECLTGEPAFAGVHMAATLAKILFDESPRVRDRRPEVPEALASLVDRMLAKSPADRPRDGHAVAEALGALGDLREEVSAEPPQEHPRHTALTGREQRAVAVILIGEAKSADGEARPRSSESSGDHTDQELQREVGLHGGHFGRLREGSVAVLLARTTLATDLAAQAAHCALAVRALAPGRSLVLVLGRGQTTDRLPLGQAMDRAALLAGRSVTTGDGRREAVPIVLDEVTAGLLDARFDVQASQTGFVLCGEREIAEGTRTLLGKATPFVGRDIEFRMLERLLDDCLEEPVAQAALVTAPAGTGKSRLAQEFLRLVKSRDERIALWIGRGDLLRAGSAFGLLGQCLRHAAGIQSGEPLSVRRQKLVQCVGERVAESERGRVAEFLGEIISTPFPDEESVPLRAARQNPRIMNDQMRAAFLDFLTAECARGPVLVLLEDLHWGDRPTVEFLDFALRELHDRPLFVLALARPEVKGFFPNLWDDRRLQEIRLSALTRRAIEHLARHVLGDRVARESLARLVKLSEGNAFYLEELIRSEAEGHGDDLPETVVAMVQSRLGALDDEARRLLRAGSVFGEIFWVEGVALLLGGEEHAPGVRERLRELIAREVVVKRGESRFPGHEEYAFRHALLREGAYAMLTDEDRSLGHRLAGEWLEERGESEVLVLAEHFEQGRQWERAAVLYTSAADQAIAAHDLEAALAHAQRGLSCRAEGTTRGALLGCQSIIYTWRGQLEAADRSGTEALGLIAAGSVRWCQCIGHMFLVLIHRNQPEGLAALAQTFVSTEPAGDALAPYVEAGLMLVGAYSCAGALDAARSIRERIDRVAAGAGLTDALTRGWVKYWTAFCDNLLSADPWSPCVAAEEAIASFREVGLGYRRLVAAPYAMLGVAQADLFGVATAEATFRAGLTIVEPLHEVASVAFISMYLVVLLAERGAPERLEEARAVARDILDKLADSAIHKGQAYCALAHIYLRQKDLPLAEECARKGREILRWMPAMSPPVLAVLIEVLLAQKKTAEARAVAEEGLELIRSLDGVGTIELRLRLGAAEARHAEGAIDEAREAIEEAVKELHVRANRIPEAGARGHFLGEVPAHARIQELARLWRAG